MPWLCDPLHHPTIHPPLQAFDTEFTKVDQGVLFELILVRCGGCMLQLLVCVRAWKPFMCTVSACVRACGCHSP